MPILIVSRLHQGIEDIWSIGLCPSNDQAMFFPSLGKAVENTQPSICSITGIVYNVVLSKNSKVSGRFMDLLLHAA
jgi:hypothetical protein